MKWKTKKIPKGTFGYIRAEKKRRFRITALLFFIPLVLYVTGYFQTKTTANLFTVIAILGCLPACKSAVGLIMMLLQKSMPKERYAQACEAAGNLTGGYELVITAYEHASPVEAFIVCGSQVVCFTPDEKTDCAYLEKHIRQNLSANRYTDMQVKVFKDFRHYLQRVSSLRDHAEHYRGGVSAVPDERYPDMTRDEVIYHYILTLSL